jgi:DDE_Tnp_1-associated
MTQEEIGRSLLEAFAQVPDRRSVHGRRHPLPAILALSTAAMVSGARSLYAIAQWGRAQRPEVVRALGFTRARTPAVATLHYTFKALDVDAFEAALQRWARRVGAGAATRSQPRPVLAPLALDGKGLRGIHGEEVPGVRLVALYDVQAGLVLAHKGGQEP